MGFLPFLKKQDQRLPDTYEIKLQYLDGTKDIFVIAAHQFILDNTMFEFVTFDDLWYTVPISAIKCIGYDKNFSKVIAIREEMMKKQMEQNQSTKPPLEVVK